MIMVLMIHNDHQVAESLPLIDKEAVHNQVVLHYLNPCPELFRVRYDKNLNIPIYISWLCEKQYKDEWIEAVKMAEHCLKPGREKRQVWNLIANVVTQAVTNLVLSSTVQRHHQGRDEALKDFYRGFDMQELYDKGSGNYVSICTDLTPVHPVEYSSVSQALPGLIWSQAKIHGEILANAANLRAIARMCRAGQMATKELAELTGDNTLSEVDPKDTEIVSIRVGADDESLVFSFIVRERTFMWIYIVLTVIILLLLGGWAFIKSYHPRVPARDFALEERA